MSMFDCSICGEPRGNCGCPQYVDMKSVDDIEFHFVMLLHSEPEYVRRERISQDLEEFRQLYQYLTETERQDVKWTLSHVLENTSET